jgi:hypothetical protein
MLPLPLRTGETATSASGVTALGAQTSQAASNALVSVILLTSDAHVMGKCIFLQVCGPKPQMGDRVHRVACKSCRPAFLVAAGLAGFATLLAGVIAWRTRGVYRKVPPSTDPERLRFGAAAAGTLDHQS